MPSPTEYLWFLDTLVCVRVSHRDGTDQISVLEHAARRGDSPPLHVHVNEDEVFHILEGEFRFQIGTEQLHGGAGDTVLAPKGVHHTYRVESEGGRWLTVTAPRPPTQEAIEALTRMAQRFGIEIVGPPLS